MVKINEVKEYITQLGTESRKRMIYLFSHNDLDGIGCGILAKIAFGEGVEVRYNSISRHDFQLQKFLGKFSKKSELFITDLAVNDENALKIDGLVKKGHNIKLIDHHKTSLKLNDFEWGRVKVEQDDGKLTSATSLLYDYFKQENHLKPTKAITDFVELIRLYDTWEWEKEDNIVAKQLNDLFSIVGIEEFQDSMIQRLKSGEEFSFLEFEEKILSLEEEKIQRYIRRKKREIVQLSISDYCVGIVHADSNHSELGNDLGKAHPHLDYIALINVGGKRISFRTIHDKIDVAEIAKRHGGGGHAKAAGCSMDEEAFNLYVIQAFHAEALVSDPEQNVRNLKNSTTGTLYENRKKENYFILSTESNMWGIEINGVRSTETFTTFEAAEAFLKRNHCVWLSRDEYYIEFMNEQDIRINKE